MKLSVLATEGLRPKNMGTCSSSREMSEMARAVKKLLVGEAISFLVSTTRLRKLPTMPKVTTKGMRTRSTTNWVWSRKSGGGGRPPPGGRAGGRVVVVREVSKSVEVGWIASPTTGFREVVKVVVRA